MAEPERIRFAVAPTIRRFFESNTFTRGLMGPLGSGKSSACVIEIMRRAKMQRPGKDGIRRTRWAVVRNTYRELTDTTLKTFQAWVPPDADGIHRWYREKDATYFIQQDDIRVEVLFRALDRPDDIKKLLSLELTGAWVNEAREVPLAIIEALQGRVGRYPAQRDGGPTWFGLIMDTNPPDEDHWWYRTFEEQQPSTWALFKQPPGRHPNAENVVNLPPGYYATLAVGKKPEWIKVYIDGQYGFIAEGKAVFPEFNDAIHVAAERIRPLPDIQINVGVDFGLTPAAVFTQPTPSGRFMVLDELVTEGQAGITRFGERISEFVGAAYPQHANGGLRMWGDPAGAAKAQTDERTCFEILRAQGFDADPAPVPDNNFTIRREAVANALNRLVDGLPGFQMSPQCRQLRKGFNGGYAYRRIQVPGEERFTEVPDKNSLSHPHDALQYAAVGGGLHETVTRDRFDRSRRSADLRRLAMPQRPRRSAWAG